MKNRATGYVIPHKNKSDFFGLFFLSSEKRTGALFKNIINIFQTFKINSSLDRWMYYHVKSYSQIYYTVVAGNARNSSRMHMHIKPTTFNLFQLSINGKVFHFKFHFTTLNFYIFPSLKMIFNFLLKT